MSRSTLLIVAFTILIDITSIAQCNNLLTNGDASSGITGWTFSSGSSSTWVVQNSTYGPAFVSSYAWCTMSQTIDLFAAGYSANYLNQEPLVSYSQMFIGHNTNYSDLYYYKIELKNASNQVLDSYTYGSQSSPITTSSSWDTVAGNFSSYGTGLRYITVECGGKDAEYWSGNYGAMIDNSVVSVAEVLNVGICSGTFTFNNQTLSTSGTYTGSFTGTYGCDSTVVLNLHIGPYNIVDTFNLCEGDTFFYDGQNYTTTTSLSGNFTSTAGCDSNINYQVNFIELFDDTIWAGVCPGESYNFGGQVIFMAGTYSDQFVSQYGCDSNVVLVLAQKPAQFQSRTAYMCAGEPYDFGGTMLTSPGNYSNVFMNSSGCDSTVNLTLKMDQSYDTNFSMVICPNDTFVFGNQMITSTGSYQEMFFTSRGGCDSLVHLSVDQTQINLSITLQTGSPEKLKSAETEAGTSWQWLDCKHNYNPILGAINNTFAPSSGGSYAVEITKGACVDTSSCKNYIPTGIASLDTKALSIYPNPATDQLTLYSKNDGVISWIAIRDIQGRLVLNKSNIHTQFIRLNIESFASGVYNLEVGIGQNVEHLAFSKQ